MLVAMATLDGETPSETLLTAIHLERYLDTFRRAGLLLASDFTHLDSDALVSLGVTATGHQKRILRLANHIQRAESQTANQRAALPRCQSVTGRAPVRGSFEALRNTSAPNLGDLLTNCEVIVKPVPKPRTVFNRRRTAPIRFCPEGDPAPPPTRRLSQDSICL
ncbi:hypothetical protein CesoFtcFv8_009628 [Champsocephalus esox]|uniref:SAM domain-containing protein n=1 Tax=Champsocephalus esox TaxID=159716 RepID=A0AAN8C7C1_9TELE|nr:hypothetical protein CesoFtcFv8_009628 [Champsocephalus esox]